MPSNSNPKKATATARHGNQKGISAEVADPRASTESRPKGTRNRQPKRTIEEILEDQEKKQQEIRENQLHNLITRFESLLASHFENDDCFLLERDSAKGTFHIVTSPYQEMKPNWSSREKYEKGDHLRVSWAVNYSENGVSAPIKCTIRHIGKNVDDVRKVMETRKKEYDNPAPLPCNAAVPTVASVAPSSALSGVEEAISKKNPSATFIVFDDSAASKVTACVQRADMMAERYAMMVANRKGEKPSNAGSVSEKPAIAMRERKQRRRQALAPLKNMPGAKLDIFAGDLEDILDQAAESVRLEKAPKPKQRRRKYIDPAVRINLTGNYSYLTNPSPYYTPDNLLLKEVPNCPPCAVEIHNKINLWYFQIDRRGEGKVALHPSFPDICIDVQAATEPAPAFFRSFLKKPEDYMFIVFIRLIGGTDGLRRLVSLYQEAKELAPHRKERGFLAKCFNGEGKQLLGAILGHMTRVIAKSGGECRWTVSAGTIHEAIMKRIRYFANHQLTLWCQWKGFEIQNVDHIFAYGGSENKKFGQNSSKRARKDPGTPVINNDTGLSTNQLLEPGSNVGEDEKDSENTSQHEADDALMPWEEAQLDEYGWRTDPLQPSVAAEPDTDGLAEYLVLNSSNNYSCNAELTFSSDGAGVYDDDHHADRTLTSECSDATTNE